MQPLRREAMVDTEEKLLFEILQELKKMNGQADGQVKPLELIAKAPKVYTCKVCGKEYDKPIQVAHCAKRHQKEGG